mgnify:CR=1 FL=1
MYKRQFPNNVLDKKDYLAYDVANIGDLDSNGINEIALTAINDDDNADGKKNKGAFYILFIDSTANVQSIQKISDTDGNFTGDIEKNGQFGSAIAGIGDLDGDGVGDIAVGQQQNSGSGKKRGAVWILFMNSNATVKGHYLINDDSGDLGAPGATLENNDGFGSGLASVGDVNGDGIQDLVVGAWKDDANGASRDRGIAYVLFMQTDGSVLSFTEITASSVGNTQQKGFFGGSVSPAGDINGDDIPDVIIGSYAYKDNDIAAVGASWLIYLSLIHI